MPVAPSSSVTVNLNERVVTVVTEGAVNVVEGALGLLKVTAGPPVWSH